MGKEKQIWTSGWEKVEEVEQWRRKEQEEEEWMEKEIEVEEEWMEKGNRREGEEDGKKKSKWTRRGWKREIEESVGERESPNGGAEERSKAVGEE